MPDPGKLYQTPHATSLSGAERTQFAILAAGIGIWEVLLDTNTVAWDDQCRQLFGLAKDNPISYEQAIQYIHADDVQAIDAAVKRALSGQNGGQYDVKYRTVGAVDGLLRWVHFKGMAYFNAAGQAVRFGGIAQDVTEAMIALGHAQMADAETLQMANEELATTNEELAVINHELAGLNETLVQSNEDLLQFAHVTSHDLKEPARKIKTFIERVGDDSGTTLSEKSTQYLQKANRAADRMFAMIDGVLAYSRVNAAEQPIRKVSLTELFYNITTDLELLIDQQHADIRYGLLPDIEGAPILLYQLFYNLVINALKFATAGQPPVITVESSPAMEGVVPFIEIEVSDNGIGFEQRHAISIFHTFTRLNTKDQYEGTGLGLALCKKIAQRHGGSIWAEGIPGKGATFTVRLPVAQQGHSI